MRAVDLRGSKVKWNWSSGRWWKLGVPGYTSRPACSLWRIVSFPFNLRARGYSRPETPIAVRVRTAGWTERLILSRHRVVTGQRSIRQINCRDRIGRTRNAEVLYWERWFMMDAVGPSERAHLSFHTACGKISASSRSRIERIKYSERAGLRRSKTAIVHVSGMRYDKNIAGFWSQIQRFHLACRVRSLYINVYIGTIVREKIFYYSFISNETMSIFRWFHQD